MNISTDENTLTDEKGVIYIAKVVEFNCFGCAFETDMKSNVCKLLWCNANFRTHRNYIIWEKTS